MMNIKELFSDLSDKRNKNLQTYSFESLLFMSMCAIMAGEDSFTDISDYVETNKSIFDKYFDLPSSTPTHDTFIRDVNNREMSNITIKPFLLNH